MNYVVVMIERATGNEVKRSEPTSERRAKKIEAGMNINLDHDRFYVSVIAEEP